jgi:hypothetical protein
MGISEKLFEVMRNGILLNERITSLTGKADRMDSDMRKMNERLIRVETIVDMATMRSPSEAKRARISGTDD